MVTYLLPFSVKRPSASGHRHETPCLRAVCPTNGAPLLRMPECCSNCWLSYRHLQTLHVEEHNVYNLHEELALLALVTYPTPAVLPWIKIVPHGEDRSHSQWSYGISRDTRRAASGMRFYRLSAQQGLEHKLAWFGPSVSLAYAPCYAIWRLNGRK
jgi:hypothetical protein